MFHDSYIHTMKKRPVIAVDIDETMAPLAIHLADYHNTFHGTNHTVDQFNSYLFYEAWGGTPESAQKKISTFFETSEYTSRIKPFQGTFEQLSRLKLDFELHVVTARNKKFELLTREWINQYFPNIFTDVHFGSHFITNEDEEAPMSQEESSANKADKSFTASSSSGSSNSNSYTYNESSNNNNNDNSSSGGSSSSSNGSVSIQHKAISKSEMCKSIGAIILIDDNIDYIIDCATQGIHSILYGNYSWNRSEYFNKYDHPLVQKITRQTNWNDVSRAVYNICEIHQIPLISHDLVIATIQMCSTNNKELNLLKSKRLIDLAYQKRARLICLPECSAFMGENAADTLNAAEDLTGVHSPYLSSLRAFAAERSIWLSVGGFPEKAMTSGSVTSSSSSSSSIISSSSSSSISGGECSVNAIDHTSMSNSNNNNNNSTSDNNSNTNHNNGNNYSIQSSSDQLQTQTIKVYNTHIIISPAGTMIQPIYRKMHLFDCPLVGLRESNTTAPGDGPAVVDLGFAVVGLSVCYDLRFPELYTAMCMPNNYYHLPSKDSLARGSDRGSGDDNNNNNTSSSSSSSSSSDNIDSHNNTNVTTPVIKRSRSVDTEVAALTSSTIITPQSIPLSSEPSSIRKSSHDNISSSHVNGEATEIVQSSSSSSSSSSLVPLTTTRGAEIILIPSAFTVPTGTAHWETLLRARAIENQVYIVAAAQSGRHNGKRESYGHSMIINPWGDVLSACSHHSDSRDNNGNSNNSNSNSNNNNDHNSNSSNNNHNNNSNNTNNTNTNNTINSNTINSNKLENDITIDGEIGYAVFNRSLLHSIRAKMPIQCHRRFDIHLMMPKSKL